MTFGIISVVLILFMYWIPYSSLGSIILGALGISAARDAERHGVPAKAGRILSWIGVVLPIALTVLAMIALLILLFTPEGIAALAVRLAETSGTKPTIFCLQHVEAPFLELRRGASAYSRNPELTLEVSCTGQNDGCSCPPFR